MRSCWSTIWGNSFSLGYEGAAGIPADTCIWEYQAKVPSLCAELMSSVISEDGYFFLGAKNVIGKIDTKNGRLLWNIAPPGTRSNFLTFNSRYLFVDPYVISKSTGQILYDFRELIKDYSENALSRPVANEYWFVKNWQEATGDQSMLVVDIVSNSASRVNNGVFFPQLVGDTSHVVGATSKGLARKDAASGETIWEICIDRGGKGQFGVTTVFDSSVVLYYENLFFVVDLESGSLITKFEVDKLHPSLPHDNNKPKLAYTNGEVYVSNRKRSILAYDFINNEEMFELPFEKFQNICIGGDILFLLKNVIYEERYPFAEIAAHDRYTGKVLWVGNEPLESGYDVKASGNKIFVSSTVGKLRCFEWSEEYISLAKRTG